MRCGKGCSVGVGDGVQSVAVGGQVAVGVRVGETGGRGVSVRNRGEAEAGTAVPKGPGSSVGTAAGLQAVRRSM
jgi:hypothetical protein